MARKQQGYNIKLKKDVFNDLTPFWTSHGYSSVGNTLQKGIKNQLLTTADLPVNKGGGGKRRRIALKKAIGQKILDNTKFIRLDGNNNLILNYTRNGAVRRKDYQIQLPPKFGYQPRQIVTVELFGDIVDIIPIVEIDYSTYVRGQYKRKGKTETEREVTVEGVKKVRMGIRAPTGLNDAQFWSNVYSKLKSDTKSHFIEQGLDDAGFTTSQVFEDSLIDSSDILQQGTFPKNYFELRQK